MNAVLVEIDVITEYLKTGKGLLPSVYEKFKLKISANTATELLASKTFEDESLREDVVNFISKYFEIIPISEAIALQAATLLRAGAQNLAHALTAATAIIEDLPVVTSEAMAYANVEGVTLWEKSE